MFVGIGIGTTIVGSFIDYVFSRHCLQLIERWKGFPPPEERLQGAMLGSSLLVIGIFWLGWTGQYAAVSWYVPGLSTIVIGDRFDLRVFPRQFPPFYLNLRPSPFTELFGRYISVSPPLILSISR